MSGSVIFFAPRSNSAFFRRSLVLFTLCREQDLLDDGLDKRTPPIRGERTPYLSGIGKTEIRIVIRRLACYDVASYHAVRDVKSEALMLTANRRLNNESGVSDFEHGHAIVCY